MANISSPSQALRFGAIYITTGSTPHGEPIMASRVDSTHHPHGSLSGAMLPLESIKKDNPDAAVYFVHSGDAWFSGSDLLDEPPNNGLLDYRRHEIRQQELERNPNAEPGARAEFEHLGLILTGDDAQRSPHEPLEFNKMMRSGKHVKPAVLAASDYGFQAERTSFNELEAKMWEEIQPDPEPRHRSASPPTTPPHQTLSKPYFGQNPFSVKNARN